MRVHLGFRYARAVEQRPRHTTAMDARAVSRSATAAASGAHRSHGRSDARIVAAGEAVPVGSAQLDGARRGQPLA